MSLALKPRDHGSADEYFVLHGELQIGHLQAEGRT
jgi:hypothetical protein